MQPPAYLFGHVAPGLCGLLFGGLYGLQAVAALARPHHDALAAVGQGKELGHVGTEIGGRYYCHTLIVLISRCKDNHFSAYRQLSGLFFTDHLIFPPESLAVPIILRIFAPCSYARTFYFAQSLLELGPRK